MDGLSKLTDSIFPIIVLAVIAGTRILAMVRRQARNRNQNQTDLPVRKQEDGAHPLPGEPPQQGAHSVHPSPVTREDAEQEYSDDEFSAWSLSVNDEEPVKPAPVVPSKPAELPANTKNVSVFTALSSTSPLPVSGEVPAWLQSPEAPVTESVETCAPEAGGLPGNRRTLGSVESRIHSLPPLQQGIVWAEILGTPKGF